MGLKSVPFAPLHNATPPVQRAPLTDPIPFSNAWLFYHIFQMTPHSLFPPPTLPLTLFSTHFCSRSTPLYFSSTIVSFPPSFLFLRLSRQRVANPASRHALPPVRRFANSVSEGDQVMKCICACSHAHRPIKQAFTGIVQPNVVWWGLKNEKSNYNVDRLYCALKLLFPLRSWILWFWKALLYMISSNHMILLFSSFTGQIPERND